MTRLTQKEHLKELPIMPASSINVSLFLFLWLSQSALGFTASSPSSLTLSKTSLVLPTNRCQNLLTVFSSTSTSNNVNANDIADDFVYDVAVIGSGPASCSLAALLAADPSQPKVVILSKFAEKRWIPNYGCWTEEWAILDQLYSERGVKGLMEKGVDVEWKDTDCFFGEFGDGILQDESSNRKEGDYRRSIGREYLRVSREGLKDIFYHSPKQQQQQQQHNKSKSKPNKNQSYQVIQDDVLGKAINTNVFLPPGAIVFHEDYTELKLKQSGTTIKAKIVIDGTGAESPFTIREQRDREGYQIAYGVECKVQGDGVTSTHVGDYDRTKMTLFDFRSESWKETTAISNDPNGNNNNKETDDVTMTQPTFNYVMPLSDDVIFFEETSLVANPAMSFDECKRRLKRRMKSQGVEITDILEEEFCYIPMGGGLPRPGQRIVPIGAASGLVHPSTGYQVGRALASNLDVADQIVKELEQTKTATEIGGRTLFDPDAAATRILGRIWTKEAIRQRSFAVFGGEFFMTMTVDQLKHFFAGFFRLDPSMWGGFLSGWKNLPGYNDHKNWFARLSFGLTALSKLSPQIAIGMIGSIIQYILTDEWGIDLIQSVTPFAGTPVGYETSQDFRRPENQGDQAAKDEAMTLLCICDRCEEAAKETPTNEANKEAALL